MEKCIAPQCPSIGDPHYMHRGDGRIYWLARNLEKYIGRLAYCDEAASVLYHNQFKQRVPGDVMESQPLFSGIGNSEDFFRAMMHSAPLAMFAVMDERCVYGNERFAKMRGCDPANCQTCGLDKLLNETDQQTLALSLRSLQIGEVARMPLILTHEDGRQTAIDLAISGVEVNGTALALGVISEKSEKERIRRLLDRLAFHDTLTELPNRVLLFDRINQFLSRYKREGSGFALSVIDLDGFKDVNDLYGHAAGDLLLKDVSRRLSQCVRSVDTVARLGGDEFALVLHGVTTEEEARTVLNKIILELAKPVHSGGNELRVTASVGVAFCPGDGNSIHELLGRADFAMYAAKRSGGSCYRVSTGEISASAVRMQLEPIIDVIKLGIEVIDEQHEEIVACIKGILRALAGGEEKNSLKQRAEYLLQLTEEHFHTEEDIMLRYALSRQDEHISEHGELLRQLHEFIPNHDGHGLTVMTHTFKDWLLPHIQNSDADLVAQLKLAGVSG